jgi:hypothetical protein
MLWYRILLILNTMSAINYKPLFWLGEIFLITGSVLLAGYFALAFYTEYTEKQLVFNSTVELKPGDVKAYCIYFPLHNVMEVSIKVNAEREKEATFWIMSEDDWKKLSSGDPNVDYSIYVPNVIIETSWRMQSFPQSGKQCLVFGNAFPTNETKIVEASIAVSYQRYLYDRLEIMMLIIGIFTLPAGVAIIVSLRYVKFAEK